MGTLDLGKNKKGKSDPGDDLNSAVWFGSIL